MGIVNVTEDSFSDGGLWLDPLAAADHAKQLAQQGASIIDIGAESTRPGAVRVPEDVEKRRVVSTIQALGAMQAAQIESQVSQESLESSLIKPPIISVDTTRSSVAAAALEAGAAIINDVSGGQLDPLLPLLVAKSNCRYVVQHWRGWLTGESASAYPTGVVTEVYDELMRQVDTALADGIEPEQIIIDPGFGFSKPGLETNMPLLDGLERFWATGYLVLVGLSRKRFVREYVRECQGLQEGFDAQGEHDGQSEGVGQPEVSLEDLDRATAELSWEASEKGAWAVRVHNVGMTADYFKKQGMGDGLD
jgi:dihydropteroate synthase